MSHSDEIEAYIKNYAGDDSQIRFMWNGQHGGEFEDANQAFRQQVFERVLQEPDGVSIELLRALFRAETEWSAKAWCINHPEVGSLASLLLTRGGKDVLDDFLEGRGQSFDAYCECDTIDISPTLAHQLHDELARRYILETDRKQQEWLQEDMEFFARHE